MKRLWSSILMLMIVLLMSSTSFAAANETYQLDELGMSIDIPIGYIVFTRDIDDNDPNLSAYGISKKDMLDLMETKNIYLNAWDKDVNFEIIVAMIDSKTDDFNLLSDTMLNTLMSSIESVNAENNITVEDYEVYHHDQTKFMKMYTSQPNGSDIAYGLQYYTVYDNKAINVTMQSYSGRIDSKKESILKSIVNTVKFDNAPAKMDNAPDTAAFTYKDEDTGVEFNVPANWLKTSLSEDRAYIDVKFKSNKEKGLSILYGSSDMWAAMSDSEKKGLSRSDVNNELFTIDEIAEILDVSQNQISTVSYAGNDYYKCKTITKNTSYGIDLKITITSLIRIDNGYIYTFQFSGDDKNVYYKDFESLLRSVKYPTEVGVASVWSSSGISWIKLLISLLIPVFICSGPIFVYRYILVRKPLEKSEAKKIVIIYGIASFLVVSALIFVIRGTVAAGGAILLWSLVNYKVLTGGKKQQDEATSVTALTDVEPKAKFVYPSKHHNNELFDSNPERTELDNSTVNLVPSIRRRTYIENSVIPSAVFSEDGEFRRILGENAKAYIAEVFNTKSSSVLKDDIVYSSSQFKIANGRAYSGDDGCIAAVMLPKPVTAPDVAVFAVRLDSEDRAQYMYSAELNGAGAYSLIKYTKDRVDIIDDNFCSSYDGVCNQILVYVKGVAKSECKKSATNLASLRPDALSSGNTDVLVNEEKSTHSAAEPKRTVRFCHKCGGKLVSDSSYCRYCGAEVIKD